MPSLAIPNEAVEAAAKVVRERYCVRPDDGYLRAILSAALPVLAAHTWDEGLSKGRDLAAWAIGNRPESERPHTKNPSRNEQ